ncbi:hypothetical protein CYMTET_12800 [Cymbomonas tetramitiformis]|uniref:Uncharacterized protein n=1 Tax=Cymbomonas tetramitiformis TaxID=36881 RepID=A0AAE0GJK3_9CHLO|nr:hypothetical protein CYMTET_12800 [Cymbomonas tetramitiformis]KAK3279308.1 hypothetical protein CYMTET_12800 [Cymbomonas tetramitiformis]
MKCNLVHFRFQNTEEFHRRCLIGSAGMIRFMRTKLSGFGSPKSQSRWVTQGAEGGKAGRVWMTKNRCLLTRYPSVRWTARSLLVGIGHAENSKHPRVRLTHAVRQETGAGGLEGVEGSKGGVEVVGG